MHLYIITMYANDKTDDIQNESSHMYCLLHISLVSYIISSFIKKNLIHTVNEKFHMFTYISYIISRFI